MPPEGSTVEELPADDAAKLRQLYGKPSGKFLKGRDGFSHYVLDGPWHPEGPRRRVAVLSHGLGTSSKVYAGFVEPLLRGGFRVLRYDFCGHGWSHAGPGAQFDLDMLLTQLQELLDHLLAPGEPVDLFVGHSTGGLLGVQAAVSLPALPGGRRLERLALISPAFWKVTPFLVKVLDKVPSLARVLLSVKALPLVQNAYLENCDNAFAHEGAKYFYPEKYATAKADIKRMFDLHPQIVDAIAGLTLGILRSDILAGLLPTFQSLIASRDAASPKVGLFWGTHDIVVEFLHAKEVLSWPGGGSVTCVELTGMGHEAPVEDPVRVATEIARWAGPQASRL